MSRGADSCRGILLYFPFICRVFFLILCRCHAQIAFEHPCEIVGIFKAQHIRNLIDAVLPLPDQFAGTAAFLLIDELHQRLVVLLFEQR